MKKALVIVFSSLRHDARVTRQIQFLTSEFTTTVVAFENNSSEAHKFIALPKLNLSIWRKLEISIWSLFGIYRKAWETFHPYQNLGSDLIQEKWDLIVANDVESLPLAFQISNNSSKVVLDAHEYSPRHFEDRLWWKLIFQPINIWTCQKFIPLTSAMFTVGAGLAREYQKNFKCQPIILTNAPSFRSLRVAAPDGKKIKLVHHGIANPSRKLELMFEMMQQLDNRFTLDLFLMTSSYASKKTKIWIKNLIERFHSDSRIRVLPPLDQENLIQTLNHYDIGIFLLPPENFNYSNALPNKFFDFIQARLAIAIGPSPEMAGYVEQFKNGVVSSDFSPKSLATLLKNISPESLLEMKQNSDRAASELCAEKNGVIFRETINQIFA